jgi:hypothetical protein
MIVFLVVQRPSNKTADARGRIGQQEPFIISMAGSMAQLAGEVKREPRLSPPRAAGAASNLAPSLARLPADF